jgi:YD repeat-containing protein
MYRNYTNRVIGGLLALTAMASAQLDAAPLRTWTYTYNTAGQVLSADGPRTDIADITRYTYDNKGNLASTTNALGQITRMAMYNERGQPGQVTDANGVITRINYDAAGRVIDRLTRHPGGDRDRDARFSYSYDEITDHVNSTANSAQIWETYAHDRAGLLYSQKNASAEIRITHDNLGNPRTMESWELNDEDGHDALVTRITWRYDELGRKIAKLGNDSQVYTTRYDANGNVTSTSDTLGLTEARGYDALDRMTLERDEFGHETLISYDIRDNTSSITDKRQLVTSYIHDGHNNRTQLESPDTGTTLFTYDEAGNLRSTTDAEGYQAILTYDALNRPVSVAYPGHSAKNISYTYDTGTGCNYCIGRLASITDSSGTTRFSYDFLGRIESRTNIVNIPGAPPLSLTTRFNYDPAGRLLSVTNANGATIDYNWGILDSYEEGEASLEPGDYIWSIQWTDNSSGQSGTLADFVDFNPYGPINHLRYGNGLELDRQFDRDGRLESQQVTGIQDLGYQYDHRDMVTLIDDRLDPTRSEHFTYHATGRLRSASGLYGNITYSYDENGNRLEKITSHFSGDSHETYTYSSASNRLDALSIQADTSLEEHEFTYDQRGNLAGQTVSGATRLTTTHGADNRMDSVAP